MIWLNSMLKILISSKSGFFHGCNFFWVWCDTEGLLSGIGYKTGFSTSWFVEFLDFIRWIKISWDDDVASRDVLGMEPKFLLAGHFKGQFFVLKIVSTDIDNGFTIARQILFWFFAFLDFLPLSSADKTCLNQFFTNFSDFFQSSLVEDGLDTF